MEVNTEPRKKATQKRSQETVESIIKATAHILKEPGGIKLNTNKIAQKAGVSIGSLYQYFSNKESIICALIDEHFKSNNLDLQRRLEQMSREKATLHESIAEVVDLGVALVLDNKRLSQILLSQVLTLNRFKIVQKNEIFIIDVIEEHLERYKDEVRQKDLKKTAFIVHYALKGVILAMVLSKKRNSLSKQEVKDQLTELCMLYLTGSVSKSDPVPNS